ncbi:DUF1275 domain protein [Xylona heveae TC161]|uniref:DUF1275 domain protein n=1 Tax=Xylona heveae (strain CBS 132557 / TC161) TaxID=1328760 RepID=A0A165AIH6_XYLHT|nr:DUF1275 domain protein [Xylona heveae TC161]KZF20536.1 DUF1275 domain protein [Xylona heveae TC161]
MYAPRWLTAEIDTRWADLILIGCCFTSGIVDGVAFNGWSSFAGMQTGNTIFVGLGVSGQPAYSSYGWAKSLMAVVCFAVGAFCFSRVSRFLGARRRGTLMLSFGVQAAFILATAIVVQAGAVSHHVAVEGEHIHWLQLLPLGLLAVQAAGQMVASRLLAYNELPTLVVTSVLCDLFSDTRLFLVSWTENPQRNRRVAAVIAIFLGALVAGFMSKLRGLNSALWLAFALKASFTLAWAFWREKRENKALPK